MPIFLKIMHPFQRQIVSLILKVRSARKRKVRRKQCLIFQKPYTLSTYFKRILRFTPQTLRKATIVELSAVMVDILKLAETHTSAEIVQALKNSYEEEDIFEAFEKFAGIREGRLAIQPR